jgi:hypothetical protein
MSPVALTLTGATMCAVCSPDKAFNAASGTFQPGQYTNELLKPNHRMLFVRRFHFGDLFRF